MNRYTKIRDFHGARLTGVGSSDIPTLAGYNKRYGDTTLTLYREKIGLTPPKEAGERAEWGHRLEGIVLAKWIENRYGLEAAAEFLRYKMRGQSSGPFKTETECRMRDRPYVLAHADLVVTSGHHEQVCPRCGAHDMFPAEVAIECSNSCGEIITAPEAVLVEAKVSGMMAARRDDEDDPDAGYSKTDFSQNGIPAKVFLQVQWQLLAYDVREAWVAVLVDSGDYREYGPIIADPRTQEKCLALAERFWQCVEARKEPKPETWDDVQLMWPDTKDTTARVGGEDEIKVRAMSGEYFENARTLKALKERNDEIIDAFGILMGENSVLTSAEGVKFASSWTVGRPSLPKFEDLKEAQTATVSAEVAEKWKKRDALKSEVAAMEEEVAMEAVKIEALREDVSTGYRVLRPTKIKGVS